MTSMQPVAHRKFNETRHKLATPGGKVLLAMTVPSILIILLFSYFPLFGWIYSFFDYRVGYKLLDCAFTGLDSFVYAFGDTYLFTVLLNTLAISCLNLLGIPIACAIAIFLTEMRSRKYKRIIQTAITLPNFISWVIIFSITFALFSRDGLINNLLLRAGSIGQPLEVFGNKNIAWFFQAGLNIWKTAGYSSIIFFAAIASIDPELFDAADVDGAGRYGKILYITIPSLMPTIIILLLMQVGFMLSNGFDQYYVFMNPIVQQKIEVLDYYVYRIGLLENDIPASTAVSMTKTLISVTLLFGVNLLAKRTTGRSVI